MAGFCAAVFIVMGTRRIFRAGVTRTPGEIVCRYVPWYEGNAYLLNVLLPLAGIAGIGAGYGSGNQIWLRFVGLLLLCGATPLMVYANVRMWRRCSLHISPSQLTVRTADSRDQAVVVPRARVESITSKSMSNAINGVRALHVEIAYRTGNSTDDVIEKVLLGPQLTVEPIDLYNALVTWRVASDENPSELLDGIERILRGREAPVA